MHAEPLLINDSKSGLVLKITAWTQIYVFKDWSSIFNYRYGGSFIIVNANYKQCIAYDIAAVNDNGKA